MGLLAIVAARVRRVGLLPRVIRALPLLSVVCVLAGIAWIACLPLEGQFRNTYFSENALMPHQAITFFRESDWDVVRGFKGQVKEFWDNQTPTHKRDDAFVSIFESYGLSAYSTENGVYAISRASRGPHNEAMVIAAPWTVESDDLQYPDTLNEGGVSLVLALARSFHKWSFWSKNLVFVIPHDSQAALRGWVDAYHTSLPHTAGSIEGAIVLEYVSSHEFFDGVDVCFEGLNGQLPNLDLINVAVHNTGSEFAPVELLGGYTDETYEGRLATLWRHITQQAAAGLSRGRTSCPSSMFSGWRIDAITLRALHGEHSYYDITTLGRVAESTARSINNLMEHFHQSFFFYFMLGRERFVSIASYLPGAVLIAGSYSVMAMHGIATAPTQQDASAVSAAGVLYALVALLATTAGYCSAHAMPYVALLAAVGCSGMAVTVMVTRDATTRTFLHIFGLIVAGLQLTALAMVNFSLSLVLGVLMCPLAWVRAGRPAFWNASCVALAFPPIPLAAIAHYYFHTSLGELVNRLLEASNLDVWSWMLLCTIWVPLWLVSATV